MKLQQPNPNPNRTPPQRRPDGRPASAARPDMRPVPRRRTPPPPPKSPLRTFLEKLPRPAFLSERPDGETVLKGVICGALIVFFALLQTTVFARFRPFGAIPDLMMSLVIAISLTEGEKWGAVIGLISAFIIESLGGGVTLLPLLYVPLGYFCPILCEIYLSDSIPVRIIFTAVSGVGRAIVTLLCLALTLKEFALPTLLSNIVLPEYASTLVMAPVIHLLVRVILHPFHKSRAERVKTI